MAKINWKHIPIKILEACLKDIDQYKSADSDWKHNTKKLSQNQFYLRKICEAAEYTDDSNAEEKAKIREKIPEKILDFCDRLDKFQEPYLFMNDAEVQQQYKIGYRKNEIDRINQHIKNAFSQK